jgi:hypothetical protein
VRHSIALCLLTATGCAAFPASQAAGTPGGDAVSGGEVRAHHHAPLVYSVRLTPRARPASADGGDDGDGLQVESRNSGSIRLIIDDEDTFEYQLTIQNQARRTYTSARIYRGDPENGGQLVATLFDDVTMGNRYIQVRGTALVQRGLDSHQAVDALRSHPDEFVFWVDAGDRSAAALQGGIGDDTGARVERR